MQVQPPKGLWESRNFMWKAEVDTSLTAARTAS